MPGTGSKARRISDSSALQSIVEIRNDFPEPGAALGFDGPGTVVQAAVPHGSWAASIFGVFGEGAQVLASQQLGEAMDVGSCFMA